MKLEGTHQLQAPRARVYSLLTNPEVLKRCIPGCERLEETAPNTFSTTMKAGVGSIKGVFNGTVRLEDLRPPEHFRLVVDAKGTVGFAKGTGDLDLEDQGETTTVRYSGNIQLGGTIASVGQRMIQASAKMMASQFFVSLEAEAKTGEGEPPPKHGFFRTALRWLSGCLRKWFR
jgi:carbon monoxide dehydrogenase subunit G